MCKVFVVLSTCRFGHYRADLLTLDARKHAIYLEFVKDLSDASKSIRLLKSSPSLLGKKPHQLRALGFRTWSSGIVAVVII